MNANMSSSANEQRNNLMTSINSNMDSNIQTKVISDKQYPSYQLQSSGVPSVSIPNSSTANKYNNNNNNNNMNMNMNMNSHSYQSIGSSNKFGSQVGGVGGV